MQVMVELRRLVLDNFVLQLDVSLQSGFRAVKAVTTCMSAGYFIQDVFVTSPLQLLTQFGLTRLNFEHTFEQIHHHLMLCFGLFDLPLQKLLPFGQKNQLFRWMDGFETFDFVHATLLMSGVVFGERQNGQTIRGVGEELIGFLHQQHQKIIKDLIVGQHLNTTQHGLCKIQLRSNKSKKWFFYTYQKYWSEKYQLYSMLKKNSTKNIQTASTRILATNKLPKDFFPPIGRPARSLETRKQNTQGSENGKKTKYQQNNGLLFTFYRSRSSNLKLRPLNEVQQQKPFKQRQSCPVTPTLEQIWSKEDKQNNVLQKKGRTLYKISRKTLNLDRKSKNELKIDSLKY